MRKNFLILMLMSLLPLAGWAQTVTIGEVGIGEYTYGNALPTDAVVKDSEGAILTKDTHYNISVGAFSDEACTVAVEIAAMKTDGTKYYRQITGIGAYAGQTKAVWFTVKKRPVTINYTASLNRTYGDDPVALNAAIANYTVDVSTPLAAGETWGAGAATDIQKGSAPTGYSTADNNAGTGKKVTFVGGWTADNYEITYAATLTIAPKSIAGCTITAEQGDVVYTGNAITGVYTVKDGTTTLVAGKDYTVETVTNVTANFKPQISGKGNYDPATKITATTGFAVTPAPITVSSDPSGRYYYKLPQEDQCSR